MSNRPEGESVVITLFALQTCNHCKAVKNLLREYQVRFHTVYVDMLVGDERNDTMRQIKRINPSISFPTLLAGEKVIVGFKKEEIEAMLDALPKR
jgi:glutaredoxin-like protein NrdH